MTKYEVRTVDVETNDGYGAFDKFSEMIDQTTELVKAFEKFSEAKALYNTIETNCRRMDGWAKPYYLHECKMLVVNEYDEDGEWISGGDLWDYDFPDRSKKD